MEKLETKHNLAFLLQNLLSEHVLQTSLEVFKGEKAVGIVSLDFQYILSFTSFHSFEYFNFNEIPQSVFNYIDVSLIDSPTEFQIDNNAVEQSNIVIKINSGPFDNQYCIKIQQKYLPEVTFEHILAKLQLIIYQNRNFAHNQKKFDKFNLISNEKVLISGMNGLGVEIAKNLILSAIPRDLTIHDNSNVDYFDLSSNFCISEEDIGKNRATASLSKLRGLISLPFVSIEASTEPLTINFISQFTVVVLIGVDNHIAIDFNEFCREKGIKFIKTDVSGLAGYLFNDFGSNFEINDINGEPDEKEYISSISDEGIISFDERTKFGQELNVKFSQIKGMSELNNQIRKINRIDPSKYSIEGGVEGYRKYEGFGVVTEVKETKIINFKSLKDRLEETGILPDFDFSKFGRGYVLFAAFKALDYFRKKNERFPSPASSEDAEMIIEFTRSLLPDQANDLLEFKDHEDALKIFSHGSSVVFAPIAAQLGAIVAQEIIKAISHSFSPFDQWFFFDSFECISSSDIKGVEEYQQQKGRYDSSIQLFGNSFQEKIGSLKYLIVGAGSIGFEYLKNFALCGIGAGDEGLITITDDYKLINQSDIFPLLHFQKENLIGQSKSLLATETAKIINPLIKIRTLQENFSKDFPDFIDDHFWENLDGVCSAISDTLTRKYIDEECIRYEKNSFFTGSSRLKSSLVVILPHKTDSYGDDVSPIDYPISEIVHFPHSIEHCVAWGKYQFSNYFINFPEEFKEFKQYENTQICTDKMGENYTIRILTEILDCFHPSFPVDFKDCVMWARSLFNKFYIEKLKRVTTAFPEDHVQEYNKLLFWAPPRRFPHPLEFNLDDPLHIHFIISAANLRANSFSVTLPFWNENPSSIREILSSLSDISEINLKDLSIRELEEKLPARSILTSLKMKPLKLNNQHKDEMIINFITAMANLQSSAYSIPNCNEIDKQKVLSMNNIKPKTFVCSSSLVASSATIEILKLANNRKFTEKVDEIGAYRSLYANFSIPLFTFCEPSPVKIVKDKESMGEKSIAYPPNHNCWDKIIVIDDTEKGISVQEFIDYMMENHKLRTVLIAIGGRLIYGTFLKKLEERLPLPIQSFSSNDPIKRKLLQVDCAFEIEDDVDITVDTPPVYILRKNLQ